MSKQPHERAVLSPAGLGSVTGWSEAGYPKINHVATAWYLGGDGNLYGGPRSDLDKAKEYIGKCMFRIQLHASIQTADSAMKSVFDQMMTKAPIEINEREIKYKFKLTDAEVAELSLLQDSSVDYFIEYIVGDCHYRVKIRGVLHVMGQSTTTIWFSYVRDYDAEKEKAAASDAA